MTELLPVSVGMVLQADSIAVDSEAGPPPPPSLACSLHDSSANPLPLTGSE